MKRIGRREFLIDAAQSGAGLALFGLLSGAVATDTFATGTGYRVRVRGGFAREQSPGHLRIQALSLDPSFKIKKDGPVPGDLKIEFVNIWGKQTTFTGDGAKNISQSDCKIEFEIPTDKIDGFIGDAKYTGDLSAGFNFIAISDTHLGDPEAEKHFPIIQKHINSRSPLFVVDAGDIIDVDEAPQWDVFDDKLALFEVPFFSTIGNHDSYLSTDLYRERLGDLFNSFMAGDSQFLLLDNAQKFNDASLFMAGGKKEAQWDWLRAELKKPARHRFAFFHFPVFGNRSMLDPMYLGRTSPEDRAREVDEMITLFKEAGVEYIIFGHIHSPHREEMDGIIHLRLGGGGGSRPSHTADEDVSFAHLFIDENGVRDYTLHPMFEEGDFDRIEFCELPETLEAGASTPLFVHGVGKEKLFAIESKYELTKGKAVVRGNRLIVEKEYQGDIEIEADFNGMKATGIVKVG